MGAHKLYDRYRNDFVSGHVYIDSPCAADKNAHNVVLETVRSLMEQRPDLVREYFSRPSLSGEGIEEMLLKFNTTVSPGQTIGESATSAPILKFECDFSAEQIEILMLAVNEVGMFTKTVTAADIFALFACDNTHPLTSANNRKLAYMFDELNANHLITRDWQKVIEDNRLILAPSGKGPIRAKDLSVALTEAKSTMQSYRRILSDAVSLVAKAEQTP